MLKENLQHFGNDVEILISEGSQNRIFMKSVEKKDSSVENIHT